jgi:transposase
MPKRIKLRRFRRGEKRLLNAKLHDRKLPVWLAQRYRLIALVYANRSVFAAARRLGCAKETAYRWTQEFNRLGFRQFNRSSHPEGRPSQLSHRQLELLYHIAQKRPTDVGLPFTTWSMTKLQAYLVKQRHFPNVSPEWLRQLLRRAKISWQRTKTWKQSHDPQFKSKKSAFWRSMPKDPSAVSSSVTISLDPWNCGRSQAGAGHGISVRNAIAQPIRANGV